MRRAVLEAAIIAIFLVTYIPQSQIVSANPFGIEPVLIIDSPEFHPFINIESNVIFSFTYYLPKHMPQVNSFSYILDGHLYSTLPSSEGLKVMDNFYETKTYSVNKTLDNLANGNHELRIYSHLSNGISKKLQIENSLLTLLLCQQIPLLSPLKIKHTITIEFL